MIEKLLDCFKPIPDPYAESTTVLFKFLDADIALMFKLTYGGK